MGHAMPDARGAIRRRIKIAKLLSIIFGTLQWSCEASKDCKRGKIFPVFKKGKKELQASQSHFCAQCDHGADPPGNHAKAHGEKRGW